MRNRARPGLLLTGAAAWTAWVVAHYYAPVATAPEIADELLSSSFPYWREAVLRTLWSLSGAALTLLTAWGLGQLFLGKVRRWRREGATGTPFFENPVERLSVELTCGFALLSSVCVALAWLHAYRAPAVHILIAGGVGTAVVAFVRSRAALTGQLVAPRLRHADTLLAAISISLALAFALVGALAPEIEHDALSYHLWLPKRWLDAGAPVDIVHEYVSLYPLSWELLDGVAMTVGGIGAAKLLHFACLPLLAAATWLLTRSIFPTSSATLAAALAVVSPTIIWEATTAYVDLPLALFLTLSIHALTRFGRTGSRQWLVLGAVLMGGALATKHLALVVLAAMGIVLMLRQLATGAPWRPATRSAALFLLIALALPAPWYARAYAASGNPFFPELYGVFGGRPAERWSPASEEGLQRFKSRFGRERNVRTLALLPWDLSVHGAQYGGTFGPAFLILVPLAFLGGPLPQSARLIAGGVGIYVAVWAAPLSSFQLRFLIPLVPIMAAFASAGVGHVRNAAERVGPRASLLVMVPVAILLFLNLPPFIRLHEGDREEWSGWLTHVMRAAPVRVVMGAMTEDQYLEMSVRSYAAWRFIGQTLPRDARILTFSDGDHLYGAGERLWSDATAAHLVTWAAPSGQENTVLDHARRLGLSHVLFNKRQIAIGDLANLAIRSQRMRTCCLTLLWQDSEYELYRLEVEKITDGLKEPELLESPRAARSARRDLPAPSAAGRHAP